MVQRTPNTRRGRGPDRPLIADESERLRKKPPRASKTEPLDQLERLAILNGIRVDDLTESRQAPTEMFIMPPWRGVMSAASTLSRGKQLYSTLQRRIEALDGCGRIPKGEFG